MPKKLTAQQKQSLSRYILEMAAVEQDLRLQSKPGKGLLNYLIYVIDTLHYQNVRQIIKEYGYPTQKMVGAEAMKAFFLLVQHVMHDAKLQEQCLKHCDFEPNEKAHLTDRVLINRGELQLYGTQRRRLPNGTLEMLPVKDPKNLEKRRVKMGLEGVQ